MTDAVQPTIEAPPPRSSSFFRRHWAALAITTVIALPMVVFAIWAAVALGFSYSKGDRNGYVQKLSHKGWLCKTWEGELAMSPIPGTVPEKFYFSVRDDSLAAVLTKAQGSRVAITYEQHVGVPSKCFGETEYYVTSVRELK